jgi:hypothetical protein
MRWWPTIILLFLTMKPFYVRSSPRIRRRAPRLAALAADLPEAERQAALRYAVDAARTIPDPEARAERLAAPYSSTALPLMRSAAIRMGWRETVVNRHEPVDGQTEKPNGNDVRQRILAKLDRLARRPKTGTLVDLPRAEFATKDGHRPIV